MGVWSIPQPWLLLHAWLHSNCPTLIHADDIRHNLLGISCLARGATCALYISSNTKNDVWMATNPERIVTLWARTSHNNQSIEGKIIGADGTEAERPNPYFSQHAQLSTALHGWICWPQPPTHSSSFTPDHLVYCHSMINVSHWPGRQTMRQLKPPWSLTNKHFWHNCFNSNCPKVSQRWTTYGSAKRSHFLHSTVTPIIINAWYWSVMLRMPFIR